VGKWCENEVVSKCVRLKSSGQEFWKGRASGGLEKGAKVEIWVEKLMAMK